MIVSDNTIQAEGLGDSFRKMGKVSGKAAKKLATNALKNPFRFLEIGANVVAATVSRNPKAALSAIPEAINFYHTGKGLYLENPYCLSPLYNKWTKKQINYTHRHH